MPFCLVNPNKSAANIFERALGITRPLILRDHSSSLKKSHGGTDSWVLIFTSKRPHHLFPGQRFSHLAEAPPAAVRYSVSEQRGPAYPTDRQASNLA